jgi:hypothetical protein
MSFVAMSTMEATKGDVSEGHLRRNVSRVCGTEASQV